MTTVDKSRRHIAPRFAISTASLRDNGQLRPSTMILSQESAIFTNLLEALTRSREYIVKHPTHLLKYVEAPHEWPTGAPRCKNIMLQD